MIDMDVEEMSGSLVVRHHNFPPISKPVYFRTMTPEEAVAARTQDPDLPPEGWVAVFPGAPLPFEATATCICGARLPLTMATQEHEGGTAYRATLAQPHDCPETHE